MPVKKKCKSRAARFTTRKPSVKASKSPRFKPATLKKDKRTGNEPALPVKARIIIERPVQHISKRLSFYRVHFMDLAGNPGWLDIPRRTFARPADVIGLLLDAHADLPNDKQIVAEALKRMGNKPTLMLTDRLGWEDSDNAKASFIYFNKTYGAAHDTLQLDNDGNRNSALGKTAGTLEQWRAGLEEPCQFSDHIVFAISVAASGPLYGLIGNPEPAIYHFQGAKILVDDKQIWKSSSGKTLSARAAQSVFGSCNRNELFSFNMTAAAAEETCFSCNNLVVVLDEEGAAGGGDEAKKWELPPWLIG